MTETIPPDGNSASTANRHEPDPFAPIELLNSIYAHLFRVLFRRRFAALGSGSKLVFPQALHGIRNISIGSNVTIAYRTYLAAVPLHPGLPAELRIEDGASLGAFNHIYATKRIVIGRNVLTAGNVYISDNVHCYEDITTPIMKQPLRQKRDVEIGEGSWLGQNVCVIGAHVGNNCVIGANSVVTHDIPDYCVAVGSPARVIRQYDKATGAWRSVSRNNNSQ